jgi:hypothetical protein
MKEGSRRSGAGRRRGGHRSAGRRGARTVCSGGACRGALLCLAIVPNNHRQAWTSHGQKNCRSAREGTLKRVIKLSNLDFVIQHHKKAPEDGVGFPRAVSGVGW